MTEMETTGALRGSTRGFGVRPRGTLALLSLLSTAGCFPDYQYDLTPDPCDASCSPKSYEAEVLADKPVVYYRFDDSAASSVAVDSSGNGYTGTIFGAVKWQEPGGLAGDVGKAVRLDGYGAIQLPVIPSTDFSEGRAFTVELWFNENHPTPGASQFLFSDTKGDLAQGSDIQIFGGGGLDFSRWLNHAPSAAHAKTMPVLNAWHHLVGRFDMSSLRVFLDNDAGAAVTAPVATDQAIRAVIGGPQYLGMPPAFYFYGWVDEFALYDGVLPDERIAAHYIGGTTGR